MKIKKLFILHILFFIIFGANDLAKLKQRDPKVLEKIFKAYNKKLYTFLLIKTNGDRDLAEEIFSETMCSLVACAPQLRNIKKVLSWLLRIAHRKLIDYIRKKEREKKYIIEKENNPPDSSEDIFENLQKKQKILMVHIALDNVKSQYRSILKLKYLEDKSLKEIACLLNKTVTSVESLLFRARKSMKKEIGKIMKDFF